VLYNKGPKYYHASYIVHVKEKIEGEKSDDCMSTADFKGYFRIAETSSKVCPTIITLHKKPTYFILKFPGITHFGCDLPKRHQTNRSSKMFAELIKD
jgi:hypothetical protein